MSDLRIASFLGVERETTRMSPGMTSSNLFPIMVELTRAASSQQQPSPGLPDGAGMPILGLWGGGEGDLRIAPEPASAKTSVALVR